MMLCPTSDDVIYHPLPTEDVQAAAAARAVTRKGVIRDERARPAFDTLMTQVPAAPDVNFEAGEVAGVSGWWCRPSLAVSGRRLLFMHGGGYALGTAAAFCGFASQFAAAAHALTFIPDYRRAPENPFPAAIDDAFAVYAAIAEEADSLAIVGDSAGGGLTLALLPLAVAHGLVGRLRCAAAMSPWTDLAMTGETLVSLADAEWVFSVDGVTNLARLYLHGADPRNPRASPLYAELKGLVPVRIDVGGDEILLSDSLRYAERLRSAGGEVSIHVWEGMPHVFPNKFRKFAASKAALSGICEFIHARL